MPNHCYSTLNVEEKYQAKLEKIAKKGLCRYYVNMPTELIETTSPVRIVSQSEYEKQIKRNEKLEHKTYPITKEKQVYLLEKYGFDNWYDWAYKNWGTKWGCYDNDYDNGQYTFTTAWGPVNEKILEMLAKDIPFFTLSYMEEGGIGCDIEYENGEETMRYDFEEDLGFD